MEIVLNLLSHEFKPKRFLDTSHQNYLEYQNGTIKFDNVSLEQAQE
jgi:hypothetical protein